MVAFPINWSLLLVSLCQTSTSRGTLQDAQIHTIIQTCLEPLPKTRLQKNIETVIFRPLLDKNENEDCYLQYSNEITLLCSVIICILKMIDN